MSRCSRERDQAAGSTTRPTNRTAPVGSCRLRWSQRPVGADRDIGLRRAAFVETEGRRGRRDRADLVDGDVGGRECVHEGDAGGDAPEAGDAEDLVHVELVLQDGTQVEVGVALEPR